MKLLLINKKIPVVCFFVIFMVSVYLNVISFSENSDWEKKYETLVWVTSQFDGTKAVAFIASVNSSSLNTKYIEVFDVKEGKVVKKSEITEDIKKEVINNIENINGLYVKVKPLPDDGKIIKVPLEEDVNISNKWVVDSGITIVKEVFFIYPEDGNAYILILDNNYRPFFFTFNGDDEKLRQCLEIRYN